MKVTSGRRVARVMRLPVKVVSLKLESVWVRREALLVSLLLYGGETMLWTMEVEGEVKD